MSRPGESLIVEGLALSEAELRARVAGLQAERDAFVDLLRLALEELHRLTGRLERSESTIRELLEMCDER